VFKSILLLTSAFGAIVLSACTHNANVYAPLAQKNFDAADLSWAVGNPGAPVNTEYHEAFSAITKDGLTLFISSDRPGGYGTPEKGVFFLSASYDIYVIHRRSLAAPWGAVMNLGPNINTKSSEHSPNLSPDGHYLYFMSSRPGGYGGPDLYRSYRRNVSEDQGWEPALNLGEGVNGPYTESCPVFYISKDGGAYLFYVQADGPQPAVPDLKVSKFDSGKNMFLASRTIEISTPAADAHLDPWHGLVWGIGYPGGLGRGDIWQTARIDGVVDLTKTWTKPVNLGADINTEYEETMPSRTSDGTRLFFMSDRPGGMGGMDIFEAAKKTRN
jgi:hypothetical protein